MGLLKPARTKAVLSLRQLALTTVLDDLADRGSVPACTSSASSAAAAAASPSALDGLLAALSEGAGVSDSACVCALVYLGRVDAGVCPGLALTHGNLRQLLVAALAIASCYVDRREPGELARAFARTVRVPETVVEELRDALAESLGFQTYISVATFREYDEILDDIIDAR